MHKIRHVLFHVFFNIFFVFAEEKKHDAMMLVDFNLLQGLERYRFSPNGQPMSVFGDPAYPLRVHLQAPFRRGILVPEMEQYNAFYNEFCESESESEGECGVAVWRYNKLFQI